MVCPCPKHPFGCIGHPETCGCTEAPDLKGAMLDLAGDDVEAIALLLGKHIGWGNRAVFGDDDEKCGCPQCEQERDDVRAVILSVVAPVLAALRTRIDVGTPTGERT